MDDRLIFILVACSEEVLRSQIGDLLRPAGYAVLKAATSEEALRQALAPIRLAIVQGELLAVCPHLKNEPLLAGVRVIALSDQPVPQADVVLSADVSSERLVRQVQEELACTSAPPPRSSVALFRELIDGLTAHVAVLNTEGLILAVNEAWRRFAWHNGADPASLSEGANYFDACAHCRGGEEKEVEAFVEGLRRVAEGKLREFMHEYPCHSASEFRWFVARVSRVRVGGVSYLLVTHENITNQKRIEVALEGANRRVAEILGSIPDGFAAFDREGKSWFLNPAVERLMGRVRNELLTWGPWFGIKELGRIFEKQKAENGTAGRTSEVLERYFPESSCWVELQAYATAEGLLVYLRDITERRRVREAESRARKEKLERLERELHELHQLVALPRPHQEPRRLRETASELFEVWVAQYEEILELALEQRAYRVVNHTSEQLRSLAEKLGFAGAGPRDVIDLHTQALQSRTRQALPGRAYTYMEEGRLLLIEVMGNLVSYYRGALLGKEV